MMGARPPETSAIVMLNRRVQWTEEAIRMTPDPRHVKEIIEELGLEGARPADTPMIVSQSGEIDSVSRALRLRDEAHAKLNYLAMDRPDSVTLHRSWGVTHQARLMRVRSRSNSREWGTHYRWEGVIRPHHRNLVHNGGEP